MVDGSIEGVWPEPDTCVKETRFNGAVRSTRPRARPGIRIGIAVGATLVLALAVVAIDALEAPPAGARPTETNQCAAPDRVDLLARELEDAGCPEVVGLQEISRPLYDLIEKKARTLCHGRYELVFGPPKGIDTELVLTSLPVTSQKVEKLFGNFRTASHVRLESDLGPVSLVVTHQDGDPDSGVSAPCADHCPPVCPSTIPVFECQTVAAAKLADGKTDKGTLRILMGDFNVTPASQRYQHLVADGWLDAYFDAGNPECDPATGTGCTSGRDDKSLARLQDPTNGENERIDFIFVKPASGCRPSFDPPDDANGNGVGTALFAGRPAVEGPGGLAWPSDHIGVSMDLSCKAKTTKSSGKKKGTS
jgi:Endonuclease/Exonuclease/phosphatase family